MQLPNAVTNCVLDSSAVLALLFNEPGADVLAGYLPDACLSSVNLAEVISKLCEHGMSREAAKAAVDALGLVIVIYDEDMAVMTGALRKETRAAGLSLGDRACLVLARHLGVSAITSDRAWARLQGYNVVLIR